MKLEQIYEQIYEQIDNQLLKLSYNIKDLFDITHNEIEDDLQSGYIFSINIRINNLYNDSMDILIIISEKILIDAKNKLTSLITNIYELIAIYFEIKKYINNFVRISILSIDSDINSLYYNTLTYVNKYALN